MDKHKSDSCGADVIIDLISVPRKKITIILDKNVMGGGIIYYDHCELVAKIRKTRYLNRRLYVKNQQEYHKLFLPAGVVSLRQLQGRRHTEFWAFLLAQLLLD